jgi:hypothetical protein
MSQKVKFTFILSILIVLFIILNNNAIAQGSNNGIFFQAVARDNFSNPAKDRKIYIESSIIQYTATGTKVLIEQHEANTDETGVFNISLGNGKRTGGSATNLTNIDWAMGPYFLSLKIAITPRAPIPNWDYTKEWIDLGATPFGTVPYALYAGSAAGLNDKLSISDTSSMLAIYAKVQAIKSLETNVNTKIASTDTAAMLAPYKKMVNELIASNITSLTADMINNALDSKVNLIDSINLYVTPSQLAAKNFDISPINKSIATKLSLADSINRYITPTQLAASIFDPTEIINYIATKADSSKMTVLLNQKANASDISNSLSNKVNLADSNSKYVTPTQLAAKTFDISPINISIANKLNLADSNSKYVTPSQLAAKTFDTSPINISIANKLNLADSNSKYVTPTQLAGNIFDPTGIVNNLISKVDKIPGKGLSSNDYTNAEKAKLATTSGTNTGDQDLTSLATFSSLNLKLNSSDTSAMLSDRFKRDTTALSNRINLKANSIDVINNLALKANSTDVANDLALKANATDVTNGLNLKLNSSDTSAMLSDRFKRDTIALSNRINLKANSIDVVNNLALKANSTDVTNSLALKANSLDVTNSLALKANSSDVSNELALKQATIIAGTTSQFYRGDKTWQTISYSTIGAAPSAGATSITTLGTITSGTWNGTTIAVANGGTGATSLTANGVLIGNATSAVTTVAPSSNGNVLTSNGASWISSTPSVSLIREVANEFTATTAQTSFTLTQTPSVNSKVKMYINGVRISNTAYSVSGVTLTYNGTYNGAYSLTTGDRIQFDYYY